ncbi:hypothetical protein GQR58_001467 [Nymphon striatum]|nr:hypothetical protein GQR58_001467 [Nymphon striatum]
MADFPGELCKQFNLTTELLKESTNLPNIGSTVPNGLVIELKSVCDKTGRTAEDLLLFYFGTNTLNSGQEEMGEKTRQLENNSDVDYEPMESDNETIDSYESDNVDLSEHEDDGVMLSDSWKRIADIFSDCRPNSLPELVRNFSGINPALNCNANNSV